MPTTPDIEERVGRLERLLYLLIGLQAPDVMGMLGMF